ncbi:MAG: branched-chain amino acid ABC transporter permease [Acidimicrobiales bacterium]
MTSIIETILIYSLMYSVAVMGLSLVVGYAQIFVLSQAAIFGVGAFTYAVMSGRNISTDMLVVIPVAMVIGGAISLITGLPLFRLGGDYYIVASLTFQYVIIQGLINWYTLSGGPPGLYAFPGPTVLGWHVVSNLDFILLLVPIMVGAFGALLWIRRMPYGRALVAMADDEVAMEAGGVRADAVKVSVFVLAGTLAAVGGVLYGSFIDVASPGDFSVAASIAMVSMVLVGGARSLFGPFIGALLLSSLPYWLNLVHWSVYMTGTIIGALLLGVAFFLPEGFAGLARVGRRRRLASNPPAMDVTEPTRDQ